MEIEIQSIPQSVRAQYHTRLRTAKADLSRYKKLLKDQKSQVARSDLLSSSRPFGTSASDDPYGSSSDRTRLLAGTSILEDGTKRLQESHRIALETETQGADILLNLRTQREQIENARSTVCSVGTMEGGMLADIHVLVIYSGLQHRSRFQHTEKDDTAVSISYLSRQNQTNPKRIF